MSVRDLFSDEPDQKRVLAVWELTARIKDLLETSFPTVWVSGEISNLARPRSGHLYLTLKDDRAQLRAAIWRNTVARLPFDLADGLEVICRGHVDVYAPRGSYQLIVEQVLPGEKGPKGIGALELALRQLRRKLDKEGLFDPARKRPLPTFVERIAVVTSPTGAAIRDFLQVLGRRWRGADVLIAPVRVQGEGAAEEIAAAIKTVNRLAHFPPSPGKTGTVPPAARDAVPPAARDAVPIDCLVVTRGGGSLEDLWAFNEEVVVRAIAASRIPVVSAIGHEIDVTLSDLAADVRALTPSEAAELVAPDSAELVAGLKQYQARLLVGLRSRALAARSRLDAIARHHVFRRPYHRVHDLARRLDEWEAALQRATRNRLEHARQRTGAAAAQLESLSPLSVLRRGYSVTGRTSPLPGQYGQVIRRSADLTPGEQITTRFAEGSAISRVERIAE